MAFLTLRRGGEVWPAGFAVEHLAPTHAQEVAAWLAKAYERWRATEIGAARIALAARGCLPAAAPTLLRALRDYPRTHWIRAQAAAALGEIDPTSPFIQAVAEVLLDPSDEAALTGTARQTIRVLVDGMTPANADGRIVLLAGKLAAGDDVHYLLFSVTDSGSVEDVAEHGSHGIGVLVKGLMAAVARARELGLPTHRMLSLLEPIPSKLLIRLRAWVLTKAMDVPPQALVSEITRAIADRDPTGDDVRLMQRITSELSSDLYVEPWREALGAPPTPVQVGQALASHEVPREWLRALLWHPLVPDEVGGAWARTGTLMSPVVRAPERESYLEPLSEPELAFARSPISKTDLERLEVADAARLISSWQPTGDHLVIARELARTLQELVASDPRAWAIRPLETLALLRHPTYVNHYFGGLAQSPGDLSGLGPQLVEAIAFARTHPWEPVRLGDDDFDYDPTWQPADDAGVTLIGWLAEQDVDLGDRYDDAWEVVLAAARDRSRSSGVPSGDDPLQTAINRPCTKALQAVFQLVATEFRRSGTVREQALDLLDDALELNGWDGAEYRAIIAPRLPFLLHVAPKWVESHEATLFGDQAPGDLGQKTVELALKWGRPHRWLLERHRRALRRAVRTGATNGLDHLLVAMLWDFPGYSIDVTFRALASMRPSIVSDAGEHLARLLMHDAQAEHINRAVLFWKQTSEDQSLAPEAFRGFGWWSQVDELDQDRWEQMTLKTCERAEGNLNFPIEVAERCLRDPTTAEGLRILTRLLRGQHEPWERAQVAEIAVRALRASSSDTTLAKTRDRLRATLTDLGYFDATDL
jgi:hypothetical protein